MIQRYIILMVLFVTAVLSSCGGDYNGPKLGQGTILDNMAPTISWRSPANSATNVSLTAAIYIEFSEDMNAASITSSTITVNNGVTGTVTYNAVTRTAVFYPDALNDSMTYTVSVAGVSDLAGNLIVPTNWTFSTVDLTAPSMTSTVPSDTATNVSVGTPVSVTFNENIQCSTLQMTLNGSTVSTVCSGNTATHTPAANLGFNTLYTVEVAAGVEDLSGNPTTTVTWSFTTGAADTTPDVFSFPSVSDVELNTQVTSTTITVTGINAPAAISVSGGSYSINGGGFTPAAGTVNNNDTVAVQLTSAPTGSTAAIATLTIDAVSASFTAVTGDWTPDPFSFTPLSDVATSSTLTSITPITVNGINIPAPISVSGNPTSEYSVNGGIYTSSSGTVNSGDTVMVRQTSSSSGGVTTSAVMTIGSASASFDVTTVIDTYPDLFSFSTKTVGTGAVVVSDPITVTGINAPAIISVSAGGSYSINGSPTFNTVDGTVNVNDTVRVLQTASSTSGVTTTVTLTIGGRSADFNVDAL